MNNPQRTPQQEPDVSIYDPECVVNSPHIIAEWLNNIDFAPNNNDKYLEYFTTLISEYCCEEDGTLPGPPEFWLRNVLSYSFFFGLGVTIFDRNHARKMSYALKEEENRHLSYWLEWVIDSNHKYLAHQWDHSINVLTFIIGKTYPQVTGPDAEPILAKELGTIEGFTTAIRFGLNDPEYARKLFGGATDEHEKCDDETLLARLNWIRVTIADAWGKNKARSTN